MVRWWGEKYEVVKYGAGRALGIGNGVVLGAIWVLGVRWSMGRVAGRSAR